MPEISDNGRTYLFKIRRGIYFTPDPAFKGQKRRLTAEDFVYSFKRFADPKNRSPWAWMVEGKIEGLDAQIEAARKSGAFDYDENDSGHGGARQIHAALQAHVARLPVPVHSARTCRSARWRARSSRHTATTRRRIRSAPVPICSRNGNGQQRSFSRRIRTTAASSGTSEPTDDPWDAQVVKSMRGKQMPQIGRASRSASSRKSSRAGSRSARRKLDYLELARHLPAAGVRRATTS